jgi:uroporphyrin-III C-methyltransferase
MPSALHHPLPDQHGPAQGEVWLVGAGPGDPRLLTIAAADAIRAADIIFHDTLPGPGILQYARADAQRIDVGKRKGAPSSTQSEISTALIAAARAGKRVVRLKGGDPGIFGRAAEELQALADAGIAWRILPGVTAASSAAAAAGIPLTLRGTARAVTFLTGHDLDSRLPEWAQAGDAAGTLVAYMALTKIDEVALRLLAAGRKPSTPVVLVARASLPGQRVLRTTLGAATLDISRARLPGPALLIIGEAAGFQAIPKAQQERLHARA